MSGNTSETRCKHERKEYISGNTYCKDCKIWINAGHPPDGEADKIADTYEEGDENPNNVRPAPGGEAVPEQEGDFHSGGCNDKCSPPYGHYYPAAPVVSTAAPEPDEPQWFQKKPVKIRALQWTGNNEDEMGRFTPGKFTISDSGARLFIATLEGTMEAQVLDWIICGVKGEFYPCKPEIFEASYTPVAPESYKPAEGAKIHQGIWPICDWCGTELEKQGSGAGKCPKCGAMKFDPAATPVTVEAPDGLRKLANWLEGWKLVEDIHANVALQVAIEQLFDAEENGEIKHLLATPKPIGDVEAVARKVYEAIDEESAKLAMAQPFSTYIPPSKEVSDVMLAAIKTSISPFFAPAGPENKEQK